MKLAVEQKKLAVEQKKREAKAKSKVKAQWAIFF